MKSRLSGFKCTMRSTNIQTILAVKFEYLFNQLDDLELECFGIKRVGKFKKYYV